MLQVYLYLISIYLYIYISLYIYLEILWIHSMVLLYDMVDTAFIDIPFVSARYGSNRGHDSLVCFSISKDGLLKLEGFTYTGGAAEDG